MIRLETHGARHLARELARFDKRAELDLLENCNSNLQVSAWFEREACHEKRLAVAMYLDTRDRNCRRTLIQVCHDAAFIRNCRELVAMFPPVAA